MNPTPDFAALDAFVAARATYRPREFVQRELSFASSAQLYLAHLHAAAAMA